MKPTATTRASTGILVAALLAACWLIAPGEAHADVYAAQLEVSNPDGSEFDGDLSDGSDALLSFYLNDDASSVTVAIKEAATGTVVDEIDLGAQSRGRVETTWDGTGSQSGTEYVFEVTAEQDNYSNDEWTVFFDSGDIDIYSRGGDVVTDMTSPYFGSIFAPNTGGPLGKGISIYNNDASQQDPFLVARDMTSDGDIDWGSGTDSMFSGVLDDEGRFYVSAVDHGEIRRLNADNTLTTVVSGLINPKGLWIDGTGEDRTLYVADDSLIVRAAIGDEDVFSGDVEVVGQFTGAFPRNIALDDDGFLYASFRTSNGLASDPLSLEKFDISGDLPVTNDESVWSIGEEVTHRVSSLEVDRGDDLDSAEDDILYYATRAGNGSTGDGIWRVDDLEAAFPTVTQVVEELQLYDNDSANINDRAAIALDPAGNFVLMENSNEHIFFASPPGEGETNSFTTTSAVSFTVDQNVAAERPEIPEGYSLEQNFPNPFNPTTTVAYTLGADGHTTLKVYNSLGQQVRTLVDRHQTAGSYEAGWDGRDELGRSLGSGVYILVVESGAFRQSVNMTLVK